MNKLVFIFLFVSATSSVTLAKTCVGTMNGMTLSGNANNRLQRLKTRFENCTKIEGNLEITSLPSNNPDLTFLTLIEEVTGYVIIYDINAPTIPLPNLKLIRGNTLYSKEMYHPKTKEKMVGNFSLFVVHNNGLQDLGLNSLIDIMRGEVVFYMNNELCYDEKVLWKDTFTSDQSELIREVAEGAATQCTCHESCPEFEGKQHCWGPRYDQCQNLTKVVCKESCALRCYGSGWNECCNDQCAGGCTGRSNKECYSCSYFNEDGGCVDSCSPPQIYDYMTFLWKPNPKAKYAYGHECLTKCPEHMYIDVGACVRKCPEGFEAIDEICKPCEGACPKTCPGTLDTFLSNDNFESFRGCTVVQGNIMIVDTTFKEEYHHRPLTYENLSLLENVTLVEGSVVVDAHSDMFHNLTFLRNLKTIRGKEPVHGKYGLYIYKTSLESLAMDSLSSVMNGRIVVADNKNLCYMDNFDWLSIRKSSAHISVSNNRNVTECELENKICHSECMDSGCFGPLDSQCLKCKGHKQGNRCVPSCEAGWFPSNQQGGECFKCHEQCQGSCTGLGANECNECLNFQDGPYCVEQCPSSKFPDESGKCQNCSSTCVGGCNGPEDNKGERGCHDCNLVIMDESGTREVKCLPVGSFCPPGHYMYRNKQCHMCHSECSECLGAGSSNCNLNTCKNAVYDSKCVNKCPRNYFPAPLIGSRPQCKECHDQCLTCYGATSIECDSCRILKVYLNYEDRQTDGRFNCTETCPSWAPFKNQEIVNGSHDSICVSSEHNSEEMVSPRKSHAGLVVGLIVGALILLAIIVVVIFFLRRQRARWDLEKTKMEAKMGGFDDETEPLALTGAAPDTSQLRIIKESEIRKEEVIGSGAFGTVHKGVWVPTGENIRIPVAIKVLNEGTSASQNKELLDEARIMASVDHPNCVKISAICMTNPIQLITPLMPFGSLLDYLRKNKNCIGSRSLLRWTTQIAKGMKYLEDRGIVHRDLAARNVLVKNANHVKITDFGLSKLLDVDQSQVEAKDGKLPIKWMAIESIRHRIFTHKSDVWSYGVTIWELFTYGQRPYEYLSAVDVLETLEKGERLSQPDICTIDIYMIMIKCWMVDAASRPSFQELVEEFGKMSRDPGRYLVIRGDQFMKLPVQNVDAKDLVKDDGPEEIMSAEDYYLQPVEPKKSDGNNYVNSPKINIETRDVGFSDFKKGKESTDQIQQGNKYTTDPTEGCHDYLGDEKELDFEVDPTSDYDPLAALVVDDKIKQQKE